MLTRVGQMYRSRQLIWTLTRAVPAWRMKSFFDALPDAAAMEKAIGKFMDCMEEQERCGFKDLHRLLACLPVPSVNASLQGPAQTAQTSCKSACAICQCIGMKCACGV
jgi:hypothetical protein